ncbi:siderophore-interacting protein [Solimonas flava]|uniref:siderophore-interacting protein n=1 Tax=Solimonas flava TaxID=415849 RepID=UPI000405D594|nr:siderophore-interacting protein [Solimonas flava]
MNEAHRAAIAAPDGRRPQRVRHASRLRRLEVRAVERVTPHLLRVTVGGDELAGFSSPGFDDHVKLFFPAEDGSLNLPTPGPDGPQFGAGPRPAMRDYTPRHYDAAAQTLQIDFALHEAGPATRWAEQARVGQPLGVGGPRGSFLVPTDFDWHLLIGDDTALPAIARRLAELPAGARAIVIAEVDGAADEIELPGPAALARHWVHRHGGAPGAIEALSAALRQCALPPGDGYAWIAAEAGVARALRAQLLGERGLPAARVKAAAYWKRGATAVHERYED